MVQLTLSSYLISISFIWFDNIIITNPIIINIAPVISKHNTVVLILGTGLHTNPVLRYINNLSIFPLFSGWLPLNDTDSSFSFSFSSFFSFSFSAISSVN